MKTSGASTKNKLPVVSVISLQIKQTYKLTTVQIGRAGELLVQYRLLKYGIESAPLTTDAGVDLVAYSSRTKHAITIQVKSNFKPRPAGGKGKAALGWWLPKPAVTDLFALLDLSQDRVWLFTASEISKLAQQSQANEYHLYMYDDPTVKVVNRSRPSFTHEFQSYLLENRVHELF